MLSVPPLHPVAALQAHVESVNHSFLPNSLSHEHAFQIRAFQDTSRTQAADDGCSIVVNVDRVHELSISDTLVCTLLCTSVHSMLILS